MKRCPSCGAAFDAGAGFCPVDGIALVDDSPAAGQSGRMVGGAAAASAWQPAPPSGQKTADALDGRTDGRHFDADGEELLLGRTLNERYRIDDRLGAGGMGIVYRATHSAIDKPVALKVLRATYAEVEDVAKRFEMEARVASKINHPNVVNISDYGHTPYGSPYYVMELLDGPSLSDVIDNGGPMDVDRALQISIQLASGLGAAHKLGVIHRDLKPDNIHLVDSPAGEQAKILDFGIARVKTRSTRLTAAGSVVGTPEYMSPEQAQGKEVDPRSDLYSVGVILFEMLSGKVPIRGTTMVETLTKQVYDDAPSLSTVAPQYATPEHAGVVELLERLLSKDPNQRPADSEALVLELTSRLRGAAPSVDNHSVHKATVAMGSWSVGDLPPAMAPAAAAASRPGPQLSQGAPQAVGWQATPPTPSPVPAAAVAAPAPQPSPPAVAAQAPVAAPAAPVAQAAPVQPGQPMPMQIPPGYTRRPTQSMRRRDATQWGLLAVVGVLGSVGAALGVVALFQVFGGANATTVPSSAPALAPAVVEQASADALRATPPEQSAAAPVDRPVDDPVQDGGAEAAPAGDAEDGAEPAPSADPSPDSAPAEEPTKGSKTKKKSTKKAKKSKKLDELPKPDPNPGSDAQPFPEKPKEPPPKTDPPPDPGVSLGDLRDPFG